jgi:hypothetical protein
VAVSLAAASACRADGEFKPVAAVVFASIDNWVNKANATGQLSNNQAASQAIDRLRSIASTLGLDPSLPTAGAFVVADKGGQATFCAFVPIKNIEACIAFLKKLPTIESVDLDEGIYEVRNKDGSGFYLQPKGKWIYRANSRETLANVPADPLTLLGELPKRFDAAVKLFSQNVSVEFCRKLVDRCQEQFKPGQEGASEEIPAWVAGLFTIAKWELPRFVAKVNEAEEAIAGLVIDPVANKVRVDIEIKAGNGTALADRFALWQPAQTKFGGFLMPEAALCANWTGSIADDDVAAFKTWLAEMRGKFTAGLENADLADDQVKVVKGCFDDVIGVLEKTADSRQNDGGFAVLLEPAGATVVMGRAVADGGKLERVLKRFVEEAKKTDPDAVKIIKLDAAKPHEGVRFHAASLPNPRPELVALLGETLEIAMGVDDEKLFLAAGADPIKAIKKIVSQSTAAAGKEVLPFEARVSIASIAKYATSHSPMPIPGASSAIKSLDGGKDHLVLTAKPIYHGIRCRLEVEEGLLNLLTLVPVPALPQATPPAGAPPPGGVPGMPTVPQPVPLPRPGG